MAREYAVQFTLNAVNRATATIRGVTGSLRTLRGQAAATARALGMHRVGAALGRLRGPLSSLRGVVTGALAPLAGLMAAATGGGILALVNRTAAAGDAIAKMSARTGIGVVKLQELGYAAERWGASSSDVAQGLKDLTKNIGEAAGGTGEAKEVFKSLGISLRDSAGNVRDSESVMMDLAARMEQIKDPATRAAVANKLMGESGAKLAPMLAQGREEIEKLAAEKRRLGVLSAEEAAQSEAWADATLNASQAITGMTQAIGVKLMPLLQPLIDRFTEWTIVSREAIATDFAAWVETLSASLASFDFDRIVDGIRSFARWVGNAIDFIGGWKVALGALAAVMLAGPLLAVGQLAVGVVQLGWAVAATTAKLALMVGSSVVASVVSFVTALRYGVGVMGALNVVMAANPIGLIVMAVAALAGAAYLIYDNWEAIVGYFGGLWARVKADFDGSIGSIIKILWSFSPLSWLVSWEELTWFFSDLWDRLHVIFNKGIAKLTGLMPDWMKDKLGISVDASVGGAAPGGAMATPRPMITPPPQMRPGGGDLGHAQLDVRVISDRPVRTETRGGGRRLGIATETEVNMGANLAGAGL